jgi:hypothetical protein
VRKVSFDKVAIWAFFAATLLIILTSTFYLYSTEREADTNQDVERRIEVSVKYFCDACGEDITTDVQRDATTEDGYAKVKTINLDTGSDLFYMLCRPCWQKVKDFCEGKRQDEVAKEKP